LTQASAVHDHFRRQFPAFVSGYSSAKTDPPKLREWHLFCEVL
jgi:hypothetical protein